MTFFMAAGCVGVKNKPANQSWPKPVAIAELKQFDGIFQNFSLESKIEAVSNARLFDFLINQSHSHFRRETQVEIRSSPDENVLHIHLLDRDQSQIDSAELHRGVDFDLSRDSINLHGPFSGTHIGAGNIAFGGEYQRSQLYVSAKGDLLGKRTSKTSGLLFYLIPFATSEKTWMLWPKNSQQPPK